MAGGNYEKSIYNQLMDVMARLESVEDSLHREKAEHKEDIRRMDAEIGRLTKENQTLRDENARLKSIINNDSSNTSLPPSTDQKGGKPANTYNGRKKTAKKPGGQKGHKGTTLTKTDAEEMIRSGKCIHEVRDIGDTGSGCYATKYVVDLDVSVRVTELHIYGRVPAEYRSDVVYGPAVKALAVTLYSEGAMSNDRIAEFLNTASSGTLRLSAGSVYNFCSELSVKAGRIVSGLEEKMLCAGVVATDATTVSVNGKQNYIRNFSTADTVVYHAMSAKNLGALEGTGFLPEYTGTLVHDHETALYHFGTGHGECNVHVIRYLRKNTEETGNTWSGEMIKLLTGINKEKKRHESDGMTEFPAETAAENEKKYAELIAQGRKENKETKHKYAKKEEKALLNRMEKYKDNHLLFMRDFAVPFDDNMSERDLRKVKNRQKIAGGFRKESGNEMYCTIMSVVETMKRRGMGIIENTKKIFMGTPAIF